jgi:protein TonB
MFSNLVESGSHKRDLKRKGTFFLGTLVFYGVLFVAVGVGSIFAYNVSIDDRNNDEIVTLMNFARTREEERAKPVKQSAATKSSQQQGGGGKRQIAVVTEVVKNTPHLSGREFASENARVLPSNMAYVLGNHNHIPPAGLGGDDHGDKPGGKRGDDTGPFVGEKPGEEGPPLMAKATPTPTPQPKQEVRKIVQLSQGVITAKATSKPAPPYPNIAKVARAQGPVTVQIVVNEEGRVIASKATSGHPLLRAAAQQAAFQARFTPTFLSGQPVKVTGVITYNFVLQ